MIICQACGRPSGAGHGVRLRDLMITLYVFDRSGKRDLMDGRFAEAVPLCAHCCWNICSSVQHSDTHLGQEEGADDE